MQKFFLAFALLILIPSPQAASIKRFDYVSKKETIVPTDTKKPKVIMFLSAVCPCSQSHFTHLNRLQQEFPEYSFIGFHSHKSVSKAKAQKYFDQFKVNFPIYDDKDLAFADQFKALKTPHVFFLDSNDEVLFEGGVSNSRRFKENNKQFLKNALISFKNGNKINPKISKALGCYISR